MKRDNPDDWKALARAESRELNGKSQVVPAFEICWTPVLSFLSTCRVSILFSSRVSGAGRRDPIPELEETYESKP